LQFNYIRLQYRRNYQEQITFISFPVSGKTTSRIAGGTETEAENVPYQVSFQNTTLQTWLIDESTAKQNVLERQYHIPFQCDEYVTECGGRPNHRHHYVKRVSAATTLDNIMTYVYYILYSTTLPHNTW